MNGGAGGLHALLIDVAYLIAASLFIFGLKRLGSPATARSGNLLGAAGMLIAVVATLLHQEILGFGPILVGLVIGGLVGALLARLVKMTAMPQMVALLNGFGGLASALVAGDEYLRAAAGSMALTTDVSVTIMLSVLIGAVTFSGSAVAFGKLQELVTGRAVTYPFQKSGNALLFLLILALGGTLAFGDPDPLMFGILSLAALVLGVLLVVPIGGADMPVVISLLNSYSGLAAAATGFVLHNNVLIIAGALVGASGLILTQIMCKAMNRSLTNVLFGAFGAAVGQAAAAAEGRTVRELTADDAAILLGYSRTVVFVPGYGLAVSQAQHNVRELAGLLEARGVDVKYAIHPVAGRMPGHMNVILSEAGVPYDALLTMEEANPILPRADVAVVIGANDVVNPDATENPASPLAGMPIIEAHNARSVIVIKRSMATGFAGVDNPLFYRENTRMLFGDAKKAIGDLTRAVKESVPA